MNNVLNYLERNGEQRFNNLYALFGEGKDKETFREDLSDMRATGVITFHPYNDVVTYAMDFQCPKCKKKWPEVKQSNLHKTGCVFCAETWRTRSPRPFSTPYKTRLKLPEDIGLAYAAKLSAKWLSIPLRANP